MDKDVNVDYTMKDQVIFNSPCSRCEERNDEAIQLRFLTDPSLLLRTWFGMTTRGVSLRGSETTEAIQYNMSFRAEREILALNEVKTLDLSLGFEMTSGLLLTICSAALLLQDDVVRQIASRSLH